MAKRTAGKHTPASQARAAKTANTAAKKRGSRMKPGTKIAIVVCAIIMTVSMMLPFLGSIISHNSSSQDQTSEQQKDTQAQQNQDQSKDASQDSSKDANADASAQKASDSSNTDATKDVPDKLKSLADKYDAKVEPLKQKLAGDSKNLAATLNLAQTYMNWGYEAMNQSEADAEKTYSADLLKQAISYYDQYLAMNDSPTARVDRALCLGYTGKTDEALSELQKVTQDAPNNGLAWANLGMVYEAEQKTDEAKDAYQKAVDNDANDAYGAKTYATKRLLALNASKAQAAQAETAIGNTNKSATGGLTNELASKSGTKF